MKKLILTSKFESMGYKILISFVVSFSVFLLLNLKKTNDPIMVWIAPLINLIPILASTFFIWLSIKVPNKIIIEKKITISRNWFGLTNDEILFENIEKTRVKFNGLRFFLAFELILILKNGETNKIFIPERIKVNEKSTENLPEIIIKNQNHSVLKFLNDPYRKNLYWKEVSYENLWKIKAYIDKRLGKTFESEVYALKDEGDENLKGEES